MKTTAPTQPTAQSPQSPERILFELPPKLKADFESYCISLGETKSSVLRHLIRAALHPPRSLGSTPDRTATSPEKEIRL